MTPAENLNSSKTIFGLSAGLWRAVSDGACPVQLWFHFLTQSIITMWIQATKYWKLNGNQILTSIKNKRKYTLEILLRLRRYLSMMIWWLIRKRLKTLMIFKPKTVTYSLIKLRTKTNNIIRESRHRPISNSFTTIMCLKNYRGNKMRMFSRKIMLRSLWETTLDRRYAAMLKWRNITRLSTSASPIW